MNLISQRVASIWFSIPEMGRDILKLLWTITVCAGFAVVLLIGLAWLMVFFEWLFQHFVSIGILPELNIE